jgi:hypothetical protein
MTSIYGVLVLGLLTILGLMIIAYVMRYVLRKCSQCGREHFVKRRKPRKVIFFAKNRRGKKKRITFVAD